MTGALAPLLAFWGVLGAIGALEAVAGRGEAARGVRWPVNLGLGVGNGLIAAIAPTSGVAAATWAQMRGLGLFNVVDAPWWAMASGVLIIATLAQWAFHRAFHVFPLLWAIHRVHHGDNHLDATTALRFHPGEFLAASGMTMALAVALGADPAAMAGLGVAEVAFGYVAHTSIVMPLRLERMLAVVIVTPAIHRLHHSTERREYESNYGAIVTVWDRVFGSFLPPPAAERPDFRLGVDGMTPRERDHLDGALLSPFRPG